MVNSGNAFPTLYHRINQPKSTSKQSISEDRNPSTSLAMLNSSFPALSRFFGTFIMAAQIPFAQAGGGISEELSNNIIADLAPFLALFGEQVTKQFMSQSMGVADNIIFAMAPLGIITAIVGAIRVGGSKGLTAIIGRARESRSAVEIELMSSTSVDVCELWDGKGVVRAMGAAPILELIYLIPKESKYGIVQPETQKIWTEGNFGIYDFDSAKSSILELGSSNRHVCPHGRDGEVPLLGGRGAAPNISLNFGGKPIHDIEFFAAAVFGILLQLAVIVYAVLGYVLSPWNLKFQKAGYQVSTYTPLMICGTVALIIGMYLCSHIIERSTVEESWKVKKVTQAQAQVQVAWLQQGGEVNDQGFDSYALFPAVLTPGNFSLIQLVRKPMRLLSSAQKQATSFWIRYPRSKKCLFLIPIAVLWLCRSTWEVFSHHFRKLKNFFPGALNPFRKSHTNRNPQLSIRTSRQAQTTNQHTLVAIAVLISLCGFVGQFLGLRGLHWSVTVAQLVATCIMTVLRTSIRRNLLQKPKTEKLHIGYELDWMAREGIKRCAHWSVVTWGFDRPIHPEGRQQTDTLAAATMTARRRLAVLSKWPSQWRDTINSTTEAIEESINFMFSSADITIQSDYWSKRDRFEWKVVVEVGMHDLNGPHLEEITLAVKRTKLLDGPWGLWRAVRSEIEAVVGLWMLHFKDLESDQEIKSAEASDCQGDEVGLLRGKPILRVLGTYDGLERMSYELWIGRKTSYLKVDDIRNFTVGETKTCEMVIAGPHEASKRGFPVLAIITTTILERICGQVILSEFMLNVAEHVTFGGKVNLRQGDQGVKMSFGLTCAGLTGLVDKVERSGLANTEEAYMSIVPALSRSGRLPIGPNDTQILFRDIVKLTNSHISNGELEAAEWCRIWLLHIVELAADAFKHRKDWRWAGEVYLHLRQESENILHGTDHMEDVDTIIASFCEQVFASIAISGRVEGDQTPFSNTLDLVGTCMVKIFGRISQTTLASWKSSAAGGYPQAGVKEKSLCDATIEGKGFLVQLLLQHGADIEDSDSDRRTPLMLVCISGHAAIAGQLIRWNADVNAKDYRAQTPLHHASQKGHSSVVQILLASGSVAINARDKVGFSSLDLAVQQNAGPVVSLLLFYGAEDLDGKARKLSRLASEYGSEAGVKEMLEKNMDLDLADEGYGRTPLHWAAWKTSKQALEWLLENRTNQDVTDHLGDTPLHVAAMGGWMAGIECLLKRQTDINLKGHRGETPLHRAAAVGHDSTTGLLLDRGANIEARDDMKLTPLHKATSNGHSKMAQFLLDRGADEGAKDNHKRTSLHIAAENGHLVMVQLLLDRGANKEVKAQYQRTPLHLAATGGHSATVELLLDRGADKEAKDGDQRTPLHLAVTGGHSATVELLLDRGADKEAKDQHQRTPLHLAATGGHSATVELLLDRGADKEAKDGDQRTPLHLAATGGRSAAVGLLLDRGADKEAKDEDQRTPLHLAATGGHSATVELLLDRGANKEAKAQYQRTPLHLAATGGHSATVELLLDRGADKEATDGDQRTPLHLAATGGHSATVEVLLDRGGGKEVKDQYQWTPVHFAAQGGHSATVELLLDRGADKEPKDFHEFTPLHNAAGWGHLATVQLLLDRGADKEAKSYNWRTPLHNAAQGGYSATVGLLLDRGADKEAEDVNGQKPINHATDRETIALLETREQNANALIASSELE